MTEQVLNIRAFVAGHLSVAFHQNAIPAISEIVIENASEIDATDLLIEIVSEPAFARPLAIRIERIAAGGTHHVRMPDLPLDAGYLRGLAEGVRGSLSFRLAANGVPVATEIVEIQLLPPAQWGGVGAAPEILAAFVRPNDPAVDAVLRDAATRLEQAGKSGAIDGYTSGRKERVWELASAIWSALAARGIAYVLPPASFERTGQKVRGPSDVIERRVGTCLDTTLLYAACLEQAGLHPLVVLTAGHAFVGLWLKDEGFPTAVVDDVQLLRKRRDLEDMLFVETTLLTQTPAARFAHAIEKGNRQVDEDASAPLELAIDIQRSRSRGIRPLELGEAGTPARPLTDAPTSVVGLEEAPDFVQEIVVREEEDPTVDRLERWKRKLLDLTLRNKLLNFKDTRKAIALDCPAPAALEDMLAGGERFKLLGRAEVLTGADQRDAGLFETQRQDDGRRSFLLHALSQRELHTDLTDKELDARLTDLYRLTRTAFEEGGSNILFLAFGFLKWSAKEGAAPCRAPLILIPASLQRSSVRAGFRLALHDEEPRFNPTLLQLLRQDFSLRMPELEKDLPIDDTGLDVDRILQIVRTHVRDLPGWEVTADVMLSTFSFTKFLMWKDLVDRTELLKRNPVVRHLIDTPKHSYGDSASFPEAHDIDRNHHPVDVFAPLSADSSQLAAVLAAASGKDFVLFGPPGTGKSQTIANMISQCLALGKTVLFVSQKTAALEVVQRRLKAIGLGEYCLEVHSTKAQKAQVLGQLKTAWHERAAPDASQWHEATAELGRLRDELNALVTALHHRRSNGMTAYQGFSQVIGTRDLIEDIVLDWGPREHTPAERDALAEIVRKLRTDMGAIGNPAQHPLQGLEVVSWTPAWRTRILDAGKHYVAAANAFEGLAEHFGETVGLAVPGDAASLGALEALGAVLIDPVAPLGSRLLGPEGDALASALAAIEDLQQQALAPTRRLQSDYAPSIFGEDLAALRAEWTEASASNFLVRGSRQRKVRDKLQAFASKPVGEDVARELIALIELRDIIEKVNEASAPLRAAGLKANGLDVELEGLRAALAWSESARSAAARIAGPLALRPGDIVGHVIMLLRDYRDLLAAGGQAHSAYQAFATGLRELATREAELADLAARQTITEPGDAWPGDGPQMVQRWMASLNRIQDWCHWNATAESARQSGLRPIVDAVVAGRIAPDAVEAAFRGAYARWWIDEIVTNDPVLRSFSVTRQEDAIARFRAADERVSELAKQIVRARLKGDIPPPTAFGADPEWGTLARELTKRARHQPLRQLFGTIPTVLTRLTPCVMMSPLSIAQYLPADSRPFDVVIFDEASQIPVWDAIGAIARGNQVVIVGDPEQLPPTSVGERGIDEIEDGTDVADQESILDECLASNIPPRRLTWHYRSRHESLIAFSNQEYYRGQLITFPSAVTEDRAVRYVHVPNGVYERGAGRVNREEARVVVADIVRRLREPDFERGRSSLGVVTFNGEQQRLIENLLDAERRNRPELELFFDPKSWHEPVFVKNLENVQGDERDVILFSVAVAPDASGRAVATISSLNKEGGHRRLNVAITRARREMVVFATLHPDQIDLSRTAARGVRDFKHFLEFAQRGTRALAEAFVLTGGETESPFEDAVKKALESRGWIVHTQIGVSGFRIDLGIVDPDAQGRYLAGVECDGATYHRSATARDRDRLRENVLIQLGWRIRRVWSPDWWINAPAAFERLHDQLLSDLEAARAERAAREADVTAAPEPNIESPSIEPLAIDAAEAGAEAPYPTATDILTHFVAQEAPADFDEPDLPPPLPRSPSTATYAAPPPSLAAAPQVTAAGYRQTDLREAGFEPDGERFYDPAHQSAIRAMVKHVISEEAPIYADLLVHRIARAHGFSRAASRIRETVLAAAGSAYPRTTDDARILLWRHDQDATAIFAFRGLAETRDHSDIPIIELASLAQLYLSEGADREEAVRRMAQELDLGRLRAATRERLERAVDQAEKAASA
ncbi:DUF3320 domain-containing protein [Kaistia nematophila]|uniref:DUF3320 domain-containing protein n=1 Tax=Kaistia nematophila TaxID=2994654 RepID=A0A9X3IKU2_9HYPH|nr:DUF3320 domain-containing protein [Kaistia nematophila]